MLSGENVKVEDKRTLSNTNKKREVDKNSNGFLQKIKAIKHIEVIIAIICCVVLVLVYFGSSELIGKKEIIETSANDEDVLLKNLEEVLSSIKGVGDVKMLINYDGNKRIEIASREETVIKTDENGVSQIITENREPIIINVDGQSKPIILSEISGEIEGVLIVAEGAEDINVRLSLIDAVRTVLGIDGYKIQVFSMK